VLTALDPMTYAVSAVRRGFHGAAMPLDLIPARSSTLTDLVIVAGFAVVALAGAVALCRRRA
jgi:MYXO-CTERM domain-containing protein